MSPVSWVFALVLGLASVPACFGAEKELITNSECLDCHGQSDLSKTNAEGKAISLFVDEARLKASVHGTNLCVSCHTDLTRQHPDDNVAARPIDCAVCHQEQSHSYGASVHGLAAAQGDASAASCKDCHGHHDILRHTEPASRMHFSRLAATCGECHPQETQDVGMSVHGRDVAAGERDAATCTDCHSEHQIEGLKNASPLKVAEKVCGKCHTSERINTKFGLPGDRVKTFFESYHGLAVQGGLAKAANCASCHGYHRILPSSDPQSSIHPARLVATCGQCHPGATENFALGRIHIDGRNGDDPGARVNRWVRGIYLVLIVLTVGLMVAHNSLDWLRYALATLRSPRRTLPRMDRAQRVQHFLLLASFLVLAWSGFALKFPDSWFAWLMGGDELIRRWIHRIAGVLLLGVGGGHIVYVAATRAGRQLVVDLFPSPADLGFLRENVRYCLGRRATRPNFGRFGYAEKLEYWAVVWGTVIMGVTGLAIWLKIPVTQHLPRWIIDVATTVHYYEAILACLAIVVWHFYHVMFSPEVYPMNWAWLDGKTLPEHEEPPHTKPAAEDRP